MKRRGFLAALVAVLTGRRLGRLVRPLIIEFYVTERRGDTLRPLTNDDILGFQQRINDLRSQCLDAEPVHPGTTVRTRRL